VRKKILISLLVLSTSFAYGRDFVAEVNSIRHSGGLASDSNNRRFAPSADPIKLERKELSTDDQRIAEMAERLIDNNPTTAILLIEKGKIVFEKYKSPAQQNSPLFSQSMSKSLTAYTVGEMYCAGKIGPLDRPAQTYAPTLAGTVQGEATVINALTMSSGMADAVHSGSMSSNQWNEIRTGQTTNAEERKKYGARVYNSGETFRYNGLDTLTLSEIGDANGGFFNNFEKLVWAKARTEYAGYWLHDTNKQAMANAGFSATARDWGRLAMYSIEQQKSNDPCISKFMKDATSPQIRNSIKRVGIAFDNYGYQTWIGNSSRGYKSYWWLGYAGQRVGVNPEKERILVITSWREDYMGDVYRFFNEWQRY
jgi:CubicO group peptidase (beta-lactamase class C family)